MRDWRVAMALAFLGIAVAPWSFPAAAREHIHIVGSSTVYPFTKEVAERAAKAGSVPPPAVESTSTGSGIKAFCAGVGAAHPDIANASRRMKKREFETCVKNGVKDIVEVPVGLDGVTVVRAKTSPPFKLTLAQLFLALAKETPGDDGALVANPHQKWSDIDSSLPAVKITMLGPSKGSGTRDTFHELLLKKGAESLPALLDIKAKDGKRFKGLWKTLRADGVYIATGDYQESFIPMFDSRRNALAICGYSYFEKHKNKVASVPINGADPAYEAIIDRSYAGARKLYIYIKKAHIGLIPELDKIAPEYVSARAFGVDGYLLKKGFVPLGEEDFLQTLAIVKNMTLLKGDALRE